MPQVAPIIGNIALNLAIGVGASLLASVFAPQQQPVTQRVHTQRGLSFELEVGESAAVRAVVGLGRATGRLAYVNEFGADNEYVQMVIDVGHGWHDGMEHFLVDEKPETLAGSNADPFGRSVASYTVSGTPYLWVKTYTGAPGQAADPQLVANANPAGRWTANHKFTGVAYMIITVRFNADLYGSAVPRFGSVWRGLKLHDWRRPGAVWGDQSTYVFTRNPAVIRLNFRRGIYVNGVKVLGQGFPAFSCDMAGYTAAANRCDETFYDPVSGKTFPIFEYGRQISDDEEKLSVLREIDQSYCGSSFKRGGADVPLPAQQLVPVMTLRDIDRLAGEPIRVDRKGVVSTKKTMWHGQFVSHDSGWAEAPFTPRINAELESRLGGRRAEAMNQPYESLQERAQLRAEIALRRQFYAATREESFTPKALLLEPGDPITRQTADGPMLMVVERIEPVMKDGARIGARVTLSQWSNAIVPASGDTFVELPSGPGVGQANPNRTIAVSGFTVVQYQRAGGGAIHPYGKSTWTPITDPNVDQVMVRIWPSAGTEANDKQDFFASARLQNALVYGPLQPLTAYKAKAIPVRADGRACVWTNVVEFTTGAEEVPAEVADGSVTPAKLALELQNERGFLVGPGVGSLADAISQLEIRMTRAEEAALTDQTNLREAFTLLKAQNGRALAAVVVSQRAIAELNAAFGEYKVEVAAQLDLVTAGGLFKVEAQVDPETATATIMFKVRAQVGDTFGESVLQLGAEADLLGGTSDSWIGAMADRLYFLATNGAIVTQPFAVQADFVKITDLRFERIRSIDGTSIEINGTDPASFLVGS
ncbi:hypothetical protein [Devosia sediminis]|uniref:Tip attachment protein J domain-containing protein n=1 Tax=Devosia sediminis TaxID=2798801 RepID=A0A934IQN9_9HYPH|nr:hypothetical protein [Devosia sediminis]MBJ3783426.1 hypothetical protein [Devosia sediminis]